MSATFGFLKNIFEHNIFQHCAFQAVEEQSASQWSPQAESEGQEAEFLIHLIQSVLLAVDLWSSTSSMSAEVNHCYSVLLLFPQMDFEIVFFVEYSS